MKNESLLRLKNIFVPVFFLSLLAGFVAGLLVSLFNFLARLLGKCSQTIYQFVRENLAFIPLLFLGLVILALIMYFLLKKTPEVKGSGIPQSEGALRGLLTFRWLRVLINTIVLSCISFFGGLSLGAEGPSIQIGATVGHGTNSIFGNNVVYRRYVMTGGASAGLAVAFNAPLTGIIFALEEAHKRFTPMILLSAAVAVLSGEIVNNTLAIFWGGGTVMFPNAIKNLPISGWWVLVLLGIFTGLLGVLFSTGLVKSKRKLEKFKKIPLWAKLIAIFILTGIVGLSTGIIGSGHHLIGEIVAGDFTIQLLVGLLFLKLVLTILCFDSGATGGLFVPMLAIGAVFGGLFGKIAQSCGLDGQFYVGIVMFAMCAFLGASVKAPLTACVLAVELTQSFESFLPICLVVFIAYFVAELFGQKPLYDDLLEDFLHAKHNGQEKQIFDFSVGVVGGSFVCNKGVRDIMWPANCLVTRLSRDGGEIIPDGETIIKSGDTLLLRAEAFSASEAIDYIKKLTGFDELVEPMPREKSFAQQTIHQDSDNFIEIDHTDDEL